jgi:hypothetical protein
VKKLVQQLDIDADVEELGLQAGATQTLSRGCSAQRDSAVNQGNGIPACTEEGTWTLACR